MLLKKRKKFPSFFKKETLSYKHTILCVKKQQKSRNQLLSFQHNISDLIERAKNNDLLATKLLYEQFVHEMLTLSYRITRNMADAEDVIQESFLTSFQKMDKLNDPARYGGWLKKIVVNNSLKLVKKRTHFSEVDAIGDYSEEEEDNWYEQVPFDKIQAAIQELPNGCREIFTLYLMENYKHREIAELLNISVSTSKSQYQYALRLLKETLKKELN